MYHPPPLPGNMPPPSHYHPHACKQNQSWKTAGVAISNTLSSPKDMDSISPLSEEHDGNSSYDQASRDDKKFKKGDNSRSRLQSEDSSPLEDESDWVKRGLSYPPKNTPSNPIPNMPVYSQGLTHYSAPAYFPPLPPSYGNPPTGSYPPAEMWNAPHQTYPSHYDMKYPYQIPPPYVTGINATYLHSSSVGLDMSPGRENERTERKRQRPSLTCDNSDCREPSKERNKFKAQKSCKPPSPSCLHTTKSVRRRKKMYSDFVGVTYNKTHAKYQSCITHYRKQHYLGRYKLAVDAALAYDESARLLKGSSWKVNFQSRQDYEEAKFRELESVGKMGECVIDVAGSLAAVALKVEEIASNVCQSRPVRKSHKNSSHVGFRLFEGNEPRRKCHTGIGGGVSEKTIGTTISTPALTKVTPSPTLHTTFLPEIQELSASPVVQAGSLETPLPLSPNPTRHILGSAKGTPDSVIRPTVLLFKQGKECQSSGIIPANSPLPPNKYQLKTMEDDSQRHSTVHKQDLSRAVTVDDNPVLCSPTKSRATPSALGAAEGALLPTPKIAPPVIQNGTLAAASALMTLFGNENSLKD